jgi:hypothetical protein
MSQQPGRDGRGSLGIAIAKPWTTSTALPPLYARWIGDLLPGPLPRESEATCGDCAMLAGHGETGSAELFFNPETKCCTYVPALPNFVVGRILTDDDPALAAGRASVEQRIDARVAVTPLGIDRPPLSSALYRLGGAGGAFGHSRTLRCPHYLADAGGACGIWRHRNGVCSTWFCKHVRGATGHRLWQGLDQLLALVEREVSRWCVLQLNVDGGVLARLFPHGSGRSAADTKLDADALDGRISDDTYRALWGTWVGRERALYIEAAGLIAALTWDDVTRIGGSSVAVHARIVTDAYRALSSDVIPDRLVVGRMQMLSRGRGSVRVTTYNGSDPLDLPRILVDVLDEFDGRPTDEVLAQIRKRHRINIQPGLLQRLVDFGVLVPAPDRRTR